jgi:hypothetical protein
MVSRKLTMERELLQYIKTFNITVYIDNILRDHLSLSVDITIQLPETTSFIKSAWRQQHLIQQKTERQKDLLVVQTWVHKTEKYL